jgi:hypothetical protein
MPAVAIIRLCKRRRFTKKSPRGFLAALRAMCAQICKKVKNEEKRRVKPLSQE